MYKTVQIAMQLVIPSCPSISCHPILDLFKSLIILIFSVPLGPLPCHTHPLLYFMCTTNLPPPPFSVLSHPLYTRACFLLIISLIFVTSTSSH